MNPKSWPPAAALAVVAVTLALGICPHGASAASAPSRPNILWITCEDTSPDLGCYGLSYAVTPHLDRFASQGMRFTRAFTHIGVCAPSRSGIITGMYPTSLGSHPMRSRAALPSGVKCFPEYLRAAGYFCTNNSKTDYNFPGPPGAWDENGKQAHWRHRAAGQPFFAVFNLVVSHESQIRASEKAFADDVRRMRAEDRHDPSRAEIPPYYPDTPAVRRDWARYHDLVTAMDIQAGDLLKELDDAGLADHTIVFFFGDHGRGLPRAKRWLYDASTQVPLIVRYPGKIRPGSMNEELAAFVDLAPTVLNLAGVSIPAHMQGQPFLGPSLPAPREYVYGARDRMDERYDIIRSVRDKRFKYIRNYQPWKPYAQYIEYCEQMPTMRELRRLAASGELSGSAALFMQPQKPLEELYDTSQDPHEVHNLAQLPEHQETLNRLRRAHQQWMRATRDLGFIPEPLLVEGYADPDGWRKRLADTHLLERLRDVVALLDRGESGRSDLLKAAEDAEPAIRWWAMTGLGRLTFVDSSLKVARRLLDDSSIVVRMAAAEALCQFGRHEEALPALLAGVDNPQPTIRLAAALVLDGLGARARPALAALKNMPTAPEPYSYAQRVAEHIRIQCDEPSQGSK